ncbi:MAG: TolC family protein [Bradymonadaceae bacterium]
MQTLEQKTPTHPRTLTAAVMFIVALCAFMGQANAQKDSQWDVEQAVEVALDHPEIETILTARRQTARFEIDEATILPNPTLDLDHERDFGPEIEGLEASAMVHQRFSLTPWRTRLRQALPHREAALRAELDQWRLDMSLEVRLAFYRVRYHEARIDALDHWVDRLSAGVGSILAREVRGDASLYERRRIEREVQVARAERAHEQSELAAAWSALLRRLPTDSEFTLIGDLAPFVPAEPSTTRPLPSLIRLEQEALATAAEARAMGKPWWRDWEAGAGYRFSNEGNHGAERGHGLLLSLTLPIALRNTDAPRLARLKAEHDRLSAELRLNTTTATRAADAARRRLEEAMAALVELPDDDDDLELTALAEMAFAAGESSLVELLDAYGSETRLRLARIDLEWAARQAAIELDYRQGLGGPL